MPRARATTLLPNDPVFELWRRVAEFPAAQCEAALRHLMEWIATEIAADNVIWIGAVRVLPEAAAKADPFFGWRLRVRHPLHPDPVAYRRQHRLYYHGDHYGKLGRTYYQRSREPKKDVHVGLTGPASFRGAGRFRVHRLRDPDFLDFAAFRRTPHYRHYYRDAGIHDRLTIGFPVSATRESFFLIDRYATPGQRRANFSRPEAARAGLALHGLPEFHRRLLLFKGLLTGGKVLSPVERQILRGLLQGKSEKEIAAALGQKPGTVHKYVTALYKGFGVSGRAALTALWLGEKSAH